MKAQLYQVFRTYWNRPLVLVLVAMVIITLSFGIIYQTASQRSISLEPQLQRPANFKNVTSPGWKNLHLTGNRDKIRSMYLNVITPDDKIDLSQVPELQTLTINATTLGPELQEQICSLKKLTSLGLHLSSDENEIPEKFFKKLGSQLLELELTSYSQRPLGQIKGVNHLSNLELLKISELDLTPETVKAISQLPRLKTLVIISRPWLSSNTAELLQGLKDHPTLERIYASWSPFGFLDRKEEALSSIRLLPLYYSSYSGNKVAAIQVTLFVMLFVTLILFLQLWSQFILPGALLIPGYPQAHRLAALMILGGGAVVTFLFLIWMGIACLPAIAITLIMPTSGAMVALASQSRSGIIRGAGLLLGISVGGIIGGQATLFTGDLLRYGRYYAEFTLGAYPLVTCSLLMAQLSAIVIIFRRLPNMTQRLNEKYAILPGFSPWDVEKQQRALLSRGSNWQTRLLDFRPRDVQYHHGSIWKQIQLWRLGNPFRPLLIIFIILGMAGLFLIGSVYGGFYQTAPDFLPSFLSLNFLFQTTVIIAMLAVGMWYRRCKHLELETMRPVGRKNLVRQLFLAVAVDQSFAIITGLFFGFFAIYLSVTRIEADTIYTFVFIFVAAVLWMYAISTTIFAIKRAWVIWTVNITACGLLLAVIIRIAYEVSGRTKGPIAPYDQFLITTSACLITITAAIVMITFTYRKALQREWG